MTTPNLLEIVPFTKIEDLPEPTNGPYIVATKSGYYVHRRFHFGRVLVPTTEAPATPETRPTIWADINPIPAELIGQALSFFKAIYEKRKSEAMVDITWHSDHGYRLFVPPQRCDGSSVEATRNPEHYVGQIVGTIHSHCNFSAFHSGTDTHDADGHDGLHITIGDVLKTNPSIDIMISVAKTRWEFKLDEISDGPLTLHPHPEWWERYVDDPLPTTSFGYTNWQKKPTTTALITTPARSQPKKNPDRDMFTTALSLEEMQLMYDGYFTAADVGIMGEAKYLLREASKLLGQVGIAYDAEFYPSYDTAPVEAEV